MLNVNTRAHNQILHAKDLAHGKPTGSSLGSLGCNDAYTVDGRFTSQAVVDDVIFPHTFASMSGCGSSFWTEQATSSFLWIDLEDSYSVRSIYLANNEGEMITGL